MQKYFILFLLIISGLTNAQYLSKAYVLSEGSFSSGTSKLSMYAASDKSFTTNIFNPVQLGPFPDGAIFYNNYLYVVEQGNYGSTGKIYKVDTTGAVLNSASFGTNPYSLAIANGKVYITNGGTSKISVLNLSDFSAVTEIKVGVYPQEIIACNGKIYVANTSLYNGASDSTVSVIDPQQDKVIKTIVVRKDPSSFAIANDGSLLIGCPGDASYGRIYKVDANSDAITGSYAIPTYGFGKDIAVDTKSSHVFFIANSNDIVKFSLADSTAQIVVPSVFPANSYYGYAYDAVNKNHYVLDAKTYTVEGSLDITDSTGKILQSYKTGIDPRRVVLKYDSAPSIIATSQRSELSFSLSQNFPNPFNPSTKISWQMAKSGQVTLRVFDMLGEEVSVLVNEEKAAGQHTVTFNAEKLSSGIYFYQLITPGFSATRKMLLLK